MDTHLKKMPFHLEKYGMYLKWNKSLGFGAMCLKVNQNEPFATTVKNIMLVVLSEFVLKVGDSG